MKTMSIIFNRGLLVAIFLMFDQAHATDLSNTEKIGKAFLESNHIFLDLCVLNNPNVHLGWTAAWAISCAEMYSELTGDEQREFYGLWGNEIEPHCTIGEANAILNSLNCFKAAELCPLDPMAKGMCNTTVEGHYQGVSEICEEQIYSPGSGFPGTSDDDELGTCEEQPHAPESGSPDTSYESCSESTDDGSSDSELLFLRSSSL